MDQRGINRRGGPLIAWFKNPAGNVLSVIQLWSTPTTLVCRTPRAHLRCRGMSEPNPAREVDVHELAAGMPHVTVETGPRGNCVYQVGGKSFVFFRTPRADATDPDTGERYPDVIVFWVASESDKQALVQDQTSPFFTTAHFDGHPSVLLRSSLIGELTRQELAEVVQDAWLAQASDRRGAAWLAAHTEP